VSGTKATYRLEDIKALIRRGRWFATDTALGTALALGFDDEDIQDCIVNQLADTHLYKTMPSRDMPNRWQDVYRITYEGQNVYLKLQISYGRAGVVSFKEDESGRFL